MGWTSGVPSTENITDTAFLPVHPPTQGKQRLCVGLSTFSSGPWGCQGLSPDGDCYSYI